MKDKILSLKLIKWISNLKIIKQLQKNPLLSKIFNYEVILYLMCGVATTVVNYIVYFVVPLGSDASSVLIKTVIAWIAAVLFAFVVNKIFVFDSPSWNTQTIHKEFIPFTIARLLSLGFDALFMYVTVGLLLFNEPLFKILSNVFVMIANYFASKFIIFKKKGKI